MDSNHRSETQQIYSLPPLATRELLHIKLWSWWTDSNPRPADYKSAALPAELHQRVLLAQQQNLFYQTIYRLSILFLKKIKIFLKEVFTTKPLCPFGLRPPLRDTQLSTPIYICPKCGMELYAWEILPTHNGRIKCPCCFTSGHRRKES